MAKCRCCGNSRAFVMKPLCDRCFLGWNDCCAYRIALDQAKEDSMEHVCNELGFYQVEYEEAITS